MFQNANWGGRVLLFYPIYRRRVNYPMGEGSQGGFISPDWFSVRGRRVTLRGLMEERALKSQWDRGQDFGSLPRFLKL